MESIILLLNLKLGIIYFKSNLVTGLRLKQVFDSPNNSLKSFPSPLLQKCYIIICLKICIVSRYLLCKNAYICTPNRQWGGYGTV